MTSAIVPGHGLGAALAASLLIHAAAMTFSLPAPRLAAFETPAPLQVRLLEPAPALPAIELRKPLPPVAVRPRQQSAPKVTEAPRVQAPKVQAPKLQASKVEAPKPVAVPEEVSERVMAPVTEPVVAVTTPPQPPVAMQAPAAQPRPSAELLASYGKTISQALARYKEYPRIAQMRGWQGSVTMQLRVAPSGELLGAELHTSSGYSLLDEHALAMAAKAGRLPAPPEGLRDGEIAMLVPVVFRLSP